MRRSLLAYAFLLSFLTAVFLLQWAREWTLRWELWAVLLVGIVPCIVQRLRTPKWVLLGSLMGMAFACAAIARTALPAPAGHVSRIPDRSEVILAGTVTDEPDRRPTMTHYTLAVERIRIGSGATRAARGRVLVRDTQGWPRYGYGDRLRVTGTLRKPWAINEFRYDRYLELQGISALVTSAALEQPAVAGSAMGGGTMLLGALYALKEQFEKRIGQIQPEPHASFLAGLLTGSRRSIPKDVQEDFQVTGLTHILAISGYNVTIILALFGGLLFWLPLRARFLPSLAALLAFTLFTGASASVVRAAIMGALGLLALQTGRKAELRLMILWAAFPMLLWKPQYLWWDAGFQLSFLAVAGLVETGALLHPLTRFFPDALGIRESLAATLSAQLFTLPWILFLFHRVSLVAPLANLLVAPLIPIAMLLGFLSVALSAVSFPLGQAAGYGAWGVLELILRITHALASIPSASFSASLGLGSLVLLYGGMAVLVILSHPSRRHMQPGLWADSARGRL